MSFFSSPPTPFLSSPFMSSFSCSEPQDRKHIDFYSNEKPHLCVHFGSIWQNLTQSWVIGTVASSSISLQAILTRLRCFFNTLTTSFLKRWKYILPGCRLTKNISSITWKTSGRPREGCGPNDPGAQPRLRRLQARTLRQLYSIYITSNHIWITWRKLSGPHKQQGVKLSSLRRLLF